MATEFINEYEITFDIYRNWVRHPVGQKAKKNRTKRLLWKTAGLCIAVFLILLGIFLPDNAAMYIGIAFAGAMAYLLIFSSSNATKKQYKLAVAANENKPWIRTYTFSDVIKMSDFRGDAEYRYAQISMTAEDGDYFYLWLGRDYVLRILKSGFIKGSEGAFRNFIESKTKKKKKGR